MLVFGDRSQLADPTERLREIEAAVARTARLAPGLQRHSSLTTALIETGRLLQGIADADCAEAGEDRSTPAMDALNGLALRLARAVWTSWQHGFASLVELPPIPPLLDLPEEVELKEPEGYAHYALYPEAYAEAAGRLTLHAPPCVIGIRSIGTSLAPMVAAALGCSRFHTVRPHGDPFARQVTIAATLAEELLGEERHYVIVDEGPGLSGSSFNSVADWLESRGVPLERIAFVPSHAGAPGAQASAAHRQRWRAAQKVVADLGPRLPHLLTGWTERALGPLDEPLEDVSGGAWRGLVYSGEERWPAANTAWERRKFLARARGETVLLRFVGLGSLGEQKLRHARKLHAAGLVPEPFGLVHGFLAERWSEDAERLGPQDKPIAEIARYVGTRARFGPDPECIGASPGELLTMARRNTELALGNAAAAGFDRFDDQVGALAKRVARTATDNRLDRHEWLRLCNGALIKADAHDHNAAHDLIGCQDFAWDVAGASIEFDLDDAEAAQLAALCGRFAGRAVDPGLLRFYLLAYAAFRLGHAELSAEICAADQAEAARLRRRAAQYRQRLQSLLLQQQSRENWPESLVG